MPELPTSLTQPAKEPEIYTIPDQFYGVAAKAQLPKEVAAPVTTTTLPGAPTAAVPPAGGVSASGGKALQDRKWLLIPVFALLFLALLGFAAWWYLQPKEAVPANPSVTLVTPEPQPTPQPEPTPQPQPEPATTTVQTPVVPAPQADTDGDSLTTVEETLYGTNPDNADSDADGFSDSVEVTNLYNPIAVAPKKLIEAGLVKVFDDAFGAQLSYPSAWKIVTGADSVSFQAEDGQGISLKAEDNPSGQSALDWYLSKNPSVSPALAQAFTTKSGLEGVRTPDGLSAFVPVAGKMYTLTKIGMTGPLTPAETFLYPSTFTMVINGFSKKP